MEKGEIKALTGVRGLAAILVVAYHFWPREDIHSDLVLNTIGRGYLCVDLFFVLSGYVMALNYAGPFARGFTRDDVNQFLMRRVARIYPLYLALLLFRYAYTLIVYGHFHAPADPVAVTEAHPGHVLLTNLLMVQTWGFGPSVNGTTWSVSTEWAAYFLFPVLVVPALFSSRHRAVATMVFAALLVGFAALADMHDGAYHSGALDAYDGREIGPLMRCFGGFTLGLLTFRLAQWRVARGVLGHQAAGMVITAGLLAALARGLPDLAVYPFFPLLVLHLGVGDSLISRAFAGRIALRLGVLSYAIYLLHPLLAEPFQAVQRFLATAMPEPAATMLAAGVIGGVLLALSTAAYEWIERPGRQAVRAISMGKATRRTAEPQQQGAMDTPALAP